METINISILEKKPELTEKVTIQIEPLAPLSMVSDLPGSFYKSLKSPNKKMLCGLFENLLGWHFSINHRTAIQKELIKIRKKQKVEYSKLQQGSTYIPLLMEYFEIELTTVPPHFMYNDLWSKAYRRADADVHPKGTQNISYKLIPIKRSKKRDAKKPKQIASEELLKIFLENTGKFPLFYSTPTSREYVALQSPVKLNINIDHTLLKMLEIAINNNNQPYLGNSEGWINLKLNCNE